MSIALNYYSFTIPAATVTPQRIGGQLGWNYQGSQQRRVVVQLASSTDTILVEATLDETNWYPVLPAITGDVLGHPIFIEGPIKGLRATKSGTTGSALVTAIV